MNETITRTVRHVNSPLGRLRLVAENGALAALWLPVHRGVPVELPETPARASERAGASEGAGANECVLAEAARQLAEYFDGNRIDFDLPLAPGGTPFQRAVWTELARIPFGETRAYVDLARAIGRPTASRAVGAANGQNPLSIVVPCHRVVGRDGRLHGYAGGEDAKRWLLEHEAPGRRALSCSR
jgi:methylated-DNA-[protein]-cysteine S-methyltransferase